METEQTGEEGIVTRTGTETIEDETTTGRGHLAEVNSEEGIEHNSAMETENAGNDEKKRGNNLNEI